MIYVRIKNFSFPEIARKYGIVNGEKYKVISHGISELQQNGKAYIIQGDNSKIPIAVYSDEIDLIENPMSVVVNKN